MLVYGVCKGEQSPLERATGDNESLGKQDLDRVGKKCDHSEKSLSIYGWS